MPIVQPTRDHSVHSGDSTTVLREEPVRNDIHTLFGRQGAHEPPECGNVIGMEKARIAAAELVLDLVRRIPHQLAQTAARHLKVNGIVQEAHVGTPGNPSQTLYDIVELRLLELFHLFLHSANAQGSARRQSSLRTLSQVVLPSDEKRISSVFFRESGANRLSFDPHVRFPLPNAAQSAIPATAIKAAPLANRSK